MSKTPRCPHTDSRFESEDPTGILGHGRPKEKHFSAFAGPWLSRADRSAREDQWYEALIYLWVSFNAWLGLAVNDRTYSEVDSYLWKAAALDPKFHQSFSKKLKADEDYRTLAATFHNLWPVFKARAIADEGLDPWGAGGSNETRDEYRTKVLSRGVDHRDFSPPCFLDHQPSLEDLDAIDPSLIPFDWEHSLAAVYMVRCNLFHGGKSFLDSKDEEFVSHSYKILSGIWWGEIRDA